MSTATLLFRWEDYRQFAADYYNALYDFNQLAAQPAAQSADNPETEEEARQRPPDPPVCPLQSYIKAKWWSRRARMFEHRMSPAAWFRYA
jgi:hypothetical protein